MAKQIIDGKRYDTDTARFLSDYSNGLPLGDFKSERGDLYRTKSCVVPRRGHVHGHYRPGNYFLVATAANNWGRFREKTGNAYSPAAAGKIVPISGDAALAILEREGQTDLIEELFTVEDA